MRYIRPALLKSLRPYFPALLVLCFVSPVALRTACAQSSPPQQTAPESAPPKMAYDPAIFLSPIPADQLAFLKKFDGAASSDVMRDKQFRKVLKAIVPDCMFHFGHDMPLMDEMEKVMKESPQPASQFVDVKKAKGIVAPDEHCYKRELHGMLANKDTFVLPG